MLPENKNSLTRYSVPVLLFLFVAVLVRHLPGHVYDNDLFRTWAIHNAHWGLDKAYYSGTDYLPLYHYILYGFAKLLGSPEQVTEWFSYIHLVTFLFDMLGIWIIYKWIDKRYDFNTLLLLLVLNISYSYNTLLWGQVDGILSTLVFISLYLAWRGSMVWGGIFFILAVNMKLQGIIFLPVFGLLYLFHIAAKRNWQSVLLPLVAAAAVQYLLLLPFLLEKEGLPMLWNAIGGSVGRLSYVSLKAYNFWHLVVRNPWFTQDDGLFIFGMTYNKVGLILFVSTSFLALLPLIKEVWLKFADRNYVAMVDKQKLWLVGALISLLFFYFNTQMHERYCHPAFIFIAAYAYYSKDFFPFALFSITYFLSLDSVFHWMGLDLKNTELFIYNPVVLSLCYLLIIAYLAVRLITVPRQEKVTEKAVPMKSRFG